MNDFKKNVVLLSASPKVNQDEAVSQLLARRAETHLKNDPLSTQMISVRETLMHHKTDQVFSTIQHANAIVLLFPLYFFCMPAMLTRFLQDFAAEYPRAAHPANVYAIVNCGFPEPEINQEAIRVVECFARQTGRTFCGGVMVGCGGMLLGAQNAPFMRPIFERIDDLFTRVGHDACSDKPIPAEIVKVSVKFPRKMYFLAGNAGWIAAAKKYGLRKNDLKRKPYQV